jgi:hypothetical protein
MTYQDMHTAYCDHSTRTRVEMCARQQAFQPPAIDAASLDLANGIAGGNMQDIDAIIAGVVVGPNGETLAEDNALLAAVQSVWPTVAAARYPVNTS